MDYVAPEFQKTAFNCPYCKAYSQMHWNQLSDFQNPSYIYRAACIHCNSVSFWFFLNAMQGAIMIYPSISPAPMPHPDLPDDCQKDYEEARLIVGYSPRGAGALLRLVIQKLCDRFGTSGKSINENIKKMVADGLPPRMQQAFDFVRITGNNAVHPLELNLEEKPELVMAMFKLINMIVEEMITKPKEINALFSQIPDGAKEAIEKRDGKSLSAS